MVLIRGKRFRVSRRDAFLVVFGIVYALIGYSYFTIPPVFKPLLDRQFHFALGLMPIEGYGALWLLAGFTMILGGAVHRLDGLGFFAGISVAFMWSLFSFIAQFKDDAPRAYVGGCTYLAFALGVWLVAGMRDGLDLEEGREHLTWWERRP